LKIIFIAIAPKKENDSLTRLIALSQQLKPASVRNSLNSQQDRLLYGAKLSPCNNNHAPVVEGKSL
jgi:hypothetical protein